MITIEDEDTRTNESHHPTKTYISIKKRPPLDIGNVITVALAILVIFGLVWRFSPSLLEQANDTPQPIQPVLTTGIPVKTLSTEFPPTGKEISIKLDIRRGFIAYNQPELSGNVFRIDPGDKVVFFNEGKDPVTLVSDIPDFGTQVLDFDKRTDYTFTKPGTYYFYLEENENLNSTIEVKPR